jgi:hypothetical protein
MAIVASAFNSDRPNYLLLLYTAMMPRIDDKRPKRPIKATLSFFLKVMCICVFLVIFGPMEKID